MLPQQHFLYGALLSALTYLFFPSLGWNALIILASTVLVDFDHFIIYVKITKNFNPIKGYFFYRNADLDSKKSVHKKYRLSERLFIFHLIEFWILLAALSFFSRFILLVFVGIMFHMFLDCFNEIKKEQLSLLQWLLKK